MQKENTVTWRIYAKHEKSISYQMMHNSGINIS